MSEKEAKLVTMVSLELLGRNMFWLHVVLQGLSALANVREHEDFCVCTGRGRGHFSSLWPGLARTEPVEVGMS